MSKLFKSILEDAKKRARKVHDEIVTLKMDKRTYKKTLKECKQYITLIQNSQKNPDPENRVHIFEDTDMNRYSILRSTEYWQEILERYEYKFDLNNEFEIRFLPNRKYFPIPVENVNSPAFHHLMTSWGLAIQQLEALLEEADEQIKSLRKAKDDLDFWIFDKEIRWDQLSDKLLKEQLTEIHRGGNKLSKFVLDREIELKFEYKDGGNAAYVSTSFKKRRKIFLSIEPLGDQPPNVVDLYKGLILHELGHFLLHLGETANDYKNFRSLLRKKITADPDFYKIFNILLDEQLERVLRDRKREWQTWFNRLTFYLRSMESTDIKERLRQAKYPDRSLFEIDLSELTKKGWIKTYDDPDFPMAAIQTAEFLTEEYGFKRMDAFFYTLRGRLPKKSISENWLRTCLKQIPSDFKTLDLYEIHRLAIRVYRIITEDRQAKKLVMVKLKAKKGDEIELPVPDVSGIPPAGTPSGGDRFTIDIRQKKSKKGKTLTETLDGSGQTFISKRQHTEPPPHNPEGEPIPPKMNTQSQIVNKSGPGKGKTIKGKSKLRGEPETTKKSGNQNIYRSPAWSDLTGSGKNSGLGSGKSKGNKKNKSNKKKKSNTINKNEEKPENKSPKPIVLKSPTVAKTINKKTVNKSTTKEKPLNNIQKQLSKQVNKELQKIKESLKPKKTGVTEATKITPEGGSPSDFKNTQDTKLFPNTEKVIRLKPDILKQRTLTLKSGRYTQWLRPWFNRVDQVKQMQHKQAAGKSMMNSAIKNYMIYGEQRLFRDFKADDMEEYSDVYVALLVDTSASMKTDGRLERACLVAAALADCMKDCPGIETRFYGYNQNIYLCGNHETHSFGQLEPAGKTNEAAALNEVKKELDRNTRPVKLILLLTDGLPTACSVESVKWQVNKMIEKNRSQFICGLFGDEDHPAYSEKVEFGKNMSRKSIIDLGRLISRKL